MQNRKQFFADLFPEGLLHFMVGADKAAVETLGHELRGYAFIVRRCDFPDAAISKDAVEELHQITRDPRDKMHPQHVVILGDFLVRDEFMPALQCIKNSYATVKRADKIALLRGSTLIILKNRTGALGSFDVGLR